jgi:uncharacterized protein YdeI (YjbR/CyaY-like superfamily)
MIPESPIYFKNGAEFRKWLKKHHSLKTELWVGFHKKETGKPSMTWQESVGQALCFGWIDGIRKSLDTERYTIRFTPRKPKSIWSAVNLKRVAELGKLGLMEPSGLKSLEWIDKARSVRYSYERKNAGLGQSLEMKFRRSKVAWEKFNQMPPGYRKTAVWWVVSAKREETRMKRLEQLIADSEAGRKIPPLRRPGE